ncbi:MAG: DUF167 domain-containing protein [Candidatus Obscuribacterales bacterium]|nr:DUF167 domain-containing protein [Candidatus Obscuribacterales bacterium]
MVISRPYLIQENGISITLHVLPGSSKTAWAGLYGDRLKLKLTEKAIDGAANNALIAFLSRYLDQPKSSITILRGQTNKDKTVFIAGNTKSIMKKLDELLTSDDPNA